MKYIWITKAMENGGVLTTSYDGVFFFSDIRWPYGKTISSVFVENIADALTSLNSALEDDAADECNL